MRGGSVGHGRLFVCLVFSGRCQLKDDAEGDGDTGLPQEGFPKVAERLHLRKLRRGERGGAEVSTLGKHTCGRACFCSILAPVCVPIGSFNDWASTDNASWTPPLCGRRNGEKTHRQADAGRLMQQRLQLLAARHLLRCDRACIPLHAAATTTTSSTATA